MQLIKHVSLSGPSLLTTLLWEAHLLSQSVTGVTPVKPIPGSWSPRSRHNLGDWTHGSRGPRLCPSRLLSITGPGAQVLPGVPILILKAKGNCRNLIFHSKFCSNPVFVQITSGPRKKPKTWGNVLSLSEFHFQILTNQGHFRKNTSALFVPG